MHMRTVFAAKNYRSIASLGDLDDRAPFRIAGAIVQIEKKFTRKEGKAIRGCLDRRPDGHAGSCRVERGLPESLGAALAAGRVVEIKGTMDKREEVLAPQRWESGSLSAWKNQWGR